MANNASFRNCLVAMKPKAKNKDLPSTHDVAKYIHNQFVEWLTDLKKEIGVSSMIFINSPLHSQNHGQNIPGKVSCTADGWTADNTKGSFLGMTAHWIDVKDGKWTMRSEVVGFKGISGEHSGWNLGRYFVGLCDRVGISNSSESKVTDL